MGLVYYSYIYHKKSTIHVGKYTSPMDPIGNMFIKTNPSWWDSTLTSCDFYEPFLKGDVEEQQGF